MSFYFTAQGGGWGWERANTIYFWPTLSLSQNEQGFDSRGIKGHWILNSSFLFWTVGVVW